jgi:hypothetical protein
LLVARWVALDPVPITRDELLAGVKGERSTVVEDCLEFSVWVELVGICPGVESGDRYPGEAVLSAGSAGSDSSVAGESGFGQYAFVDEHGRQPSASHGWPLGVCIGEVYLYVSL